MKVVIIGGGHSAVVYPHAEEIDDADKVVRVNYYEIKGYEDRVGTRTDIWVTTQLDPFGMMVSILKGWVPEGMSTTKAVWFYPRLGDYGKSIRRILAPYIGTDFEYSGIARFQKKGTIRPFFWAKGEEDIVHG